MSITRFDPYPMDIADVLTPRGGSLVRRPSITNMPNIWGECPQYAAFECKLTTALNTIMQSQDPVKGLGELYKLSDKALTAQEFTQLISRHLGPMVTKFSQLPYDRIMMGLVPNPEWRTSKFSSIIGGVFWTVGTIENADYDTAGTLRTQLTKYSTEFLYTYRDDQFRILSYFSPFTQDQ